MGTTTGQKYEEIHFVDSTKPVWNYSLFTDEDIRNFQEGTHYSIYELMGSHRATVLGTEGYYFAVWALNATAVSVIGNFNSWGPDTHPLFVRLDRSGIWEGFIPHFKTGEAYKYHIRGFGGGTQRWISNRSVRRWCHWHSRSRTAALPVRPRRKRQNLQKIQFARRKEANE